MIKIKFILTTLAFFLFVALPIQAAQQNIGALGRIFPKGGIISLSGPPGDTVDLIMAVPENQVLEGTSLMVFASQKKREQEVETAKNNILQTEQKTAIAIALQKQKIDTISKSATDRIALQKMKIEAAQEQKLFAANNLNRLLTAGQASYSTQQKEEREHQQKIAENNLVTASLELEQLNRTRDADLELARLELSRLTADQKISMENARDHLNTAILNLAVATLKAPGPGTILEILQKKGEAVSGGPIIRMADLTTMMVIAEVFQADILTIEKGMKATITSKSIPETMTGTVVSISRIISDPSKVANVHIVLDDAALASKLLNLEVEVSILTGK